MPPKKRKAPIPTKLGNHQQFLMDNYELRKEMNENETCKTGHVFHAYLNNDRSLVETKRVVFDNFKIELPKKQVLAICRRLDSLMKSTTKDIYFERFTNELTEVVIVLPASCPAQTPSAGPSASPPSTPPKTPSSTSLNPEMAIGYGTPKTVKR